MPTKHYAPPQTLGEIVPEAGAADFLLLTQNWRGNGELDAILPRSRYVHGDAKAGGTFSEGGLVATLSAIDIGSPEGDPSVLAKKAYGLFTPSDIETNLHADMLHYLGGCLRRRRIHLHPPEWLLAVPPLQVPVPQPTSARAMEPTLPGVKFDSGGLISWKVFGRCTLKA